MIGISKSIFEKVQERLKPQFPELQVGSSADVMEVDRSFRAQGQAPTTFGSAVEEGYLQSTARSDPVPRESRGFFGDIGAGLGRMYGAPRSTPSDDGVNAGAALWSAVSPLLDINARSFLNNFAFGPNPADTSFGGGAALQQATERVPGGGAFFDVANELSNPLVAGPAAAFPATLAPTILGTAGQVGAERSARSAGYGDTASSLIGIGAGLGVGGLTALAQTPQGTATLGKLAREEVGGGEIPELGHAAGDAIKKLKAVLRTEANLRRRGVAQSEITMGRRAQAGGVEELLAEGERRGLTGEELNKFARSGARTGPLRRTVAEAMDITPQERDALFDTVTALRRSGRIGGAFDYINASEALQRAIDGTGLEPAQRRQLARLFPDLADVLDDGPKLNLGNARANAARGRGKFLPGEGPPDAVLNRMVEEGQLKIPTRGRTVRNAPAGYRQLTGRIREGLKEPVVEPPPLYQLGPQQPGRVSRGAPPLPGGGVDLPMGGSGLTQAQRAQAAAVGTQAEQARLRDVAVRNRLSDLFPTPEQQAERARAMVQGSASDKDRIGKIIEYWQRGTQAQLDNLGPESSMLGRFVEGKLKGHTTNQFINAALFRRNTLRDVLRSEGLPEKIVVDASNDMFYSQVARRYPGPDLPPDVAEIMHQLASPAYNEAIGGVSAKVQQMKNLRFGLDFAVFGQQVLASVTRGGPQLVLGLANELFGGMHSPLLRGAFSEADFGRQVAFALDGVEQGLGSSVVQHQDEIGSALRWIPKVGKQIDAPWVKMTDWLTKLQYGTVLTNVRNIAHEGNLVALKLAGRDISDPAVRKISADWANAVGSYAGSALRPGRAQGESLLRTSAAMTRSQVQHLANLGQMINPKATAEQRILASLGILSGVSGPLVAAQFLDSTLGVKDTQFNPFKPGFGQVTLESGRVVDVVPQDAVVGLIAKSVKALTSEHPEDIARVIAQFMSSGGSDVVRLAGAAARTGYDTKGTFRYGDLPLGEVAKGLAPVPPNVMEAATEGFDPESQALNFLGINNFPESGFAEAQRLTDDQYKDWPRSKKNEWDAAHPDIAARMGAEAITGGGGLGEAAKIRAERNAALANIPANASPAAIRDSVDRIEQDSRAKSEEAQALLGSPREKNDPLNVALNSYYDALTLAPDGSIDHDATDAKRALLEKEWTPEQRDFVEQETGATDPNLPPALRDLKKTRKDLDKAGFYDSKQQSWETVKTALGNTKYKSYYEWRDARIASIAAQFSSSMGEGAARVVAQQVVEKLPEAEAYSLIANARETLFVVKHSRDGLADRAIKWGYIKPTQPELGVTIAGSR